MDDLPAVTGLLWSQARVMLLERGLSDGDIRVLDITPEKAPRTPTQQFGWGEPRVVRAQAQGQIVQVTVAREMTV